MGDFFSTAFCPIEILLWICDIKHESLFTLTYDLPRFPPTFRYIHVLTKIMIFTTLQLYFFGGWGFVSMSALLNFSFKFSKEGARYGFQHSVIPSPSTRSTFCTDCQVKRLAEQPTPTVSWPLILLFCYLAFMLGLQLLLQVGHSHGGISHRDNWPKQCQGISRHLKSHWSSILREGLRS